MNNKENFAAAIAAMSTLNRYSNCPIMSDILHHGPAPISVIVARTRFGRKRVSSALNEYYAAGLIKRSMIGSQVIFDFPVGQPELSKLAFEITGLTRWWSPMAGGQSGRYSVRAAADHHNSVAARSALKQFVGNHGDLLKDIIAAPGLTQRAYADASGFDPAVVNRIVKTLENHEIVRVERCGREAVLFPVGEMITVIVAAVQKVVTTLAAVSPAPGDS